MEPGEEMRRVVKKVSRESVKNRISKTRRREMVFSFSYEEGIFNTNKC